MTVVQVAGSSFGARLSSVSATLNAYVALTKPRIIEGSVVTSRSSMIRGLVSAT